MDLKAFTIYADMARVDNTWSRFGHDFAPKVIKYEGVETPQDTRDKIWMFNGQYMDDLSKAYSFIPNEYVDELIDESDLAANGFETLKRHVSHNGRTVHWTLLSKKKEKVKVGDDIQVGAVIRNGCGTNVSLGVDVFTYRLQCLNGAVYKRKEHGFSLPHIHDVEYMVNKLKYLVQQAVDYGSDLIGIYKKAEAIPVDDRIANQLYKKLLQANHYIPDNWEVIPYKEVKELRKEGKLAEFDGLVRVTEDLSLFRTFNEITEKQRDGLNKGIISFAAVAKHQQNLHNGMIEVVAQHK